jgi:hypothetical protein
MSELEPQLNNFKNPELSAFEGIKEFLSYNRLPTERDNINTIVTLGTSAKNAPTSFNMRLNTTLEYSSIYPDAEVIFSGKQAHGNKAHPEESGDNYFEAEAMAKEAINRGLDPQRIKIENKAKNTKENIAYSLDMLPSTENILFVCSSYQGRRIKMYLDKHHQNSERNDFIVDADVREDKDKDKDRVQSFTLLHNRRKELCIDYEWSRINKYKAKGDL